MVSTVYTFPGNSRRGAMRLSGNPGSVDLDTGLRRYDGYTGVFLTSNGLVRPHGGH